MFEQVKVSAGKKHVAAFVKTMKAPPKSGNPSVIPLQALPERATASVAALDLCSLTDELTVSPVFLCDVVLKPVLQEVG